jgi:hypothetical protein
MHYNIKVIKSFIKKTVKAKNIARTIFKKGFFIKTLSHQLF